MAPRPCIHTIRKKKYLQSKICLRQILIIVIRVPRKILNSFEFLGKSLPLKYLSLTRLIIRGHSLTTISFEVWFQFQFFSLLFFILFKNFIFLHLYLSFLTLVRSPWVSFFDRRVKNVENSTPFFDNLHKEAFISFL